MNGIKRRLVFFTIRVFDERQLVLFFILLTTFFSEVMNILLTACKKFYLTTKACFHFLFYLCFYVKICVTEEYVFEAGRRKWHV